MLGSSPVFMLGSSHKEVRCTAESAQSPLPSSPSMGNAPDVLCAAADVKKAGAFIRLTGSESDYVFNFQTNQQSLITSGHTLLTASPLFEQILHWKMSGPDGCLITITPISLRSWPQHARQYGSVRFLSDFRYK
jgi:hypothetical protein